MKLALVLLAACGQDHMASESMRRPDPPAGCSCGSGFACVGAACVKQPVVGEACTPDGVRCVAGATCRDGACVSTRP